MRENRCIQQQCSVQILKYHWGDLVLLLLYLIESRQQPFGSGDANQVRDLRRVSLPSGLYYSCPKEGYLLSIVCVALRPHCYQQITM